MDAPWVDAAYLAVIDRHPPIGLGFVDSGRHPLVRDALIAQWTRLPHEQLYIPRWYRYAQPNNYEHRLDPSLHVWNHQHIRRGIQLLNWVPPAQRFCQVATDGASSENKRTASYGGVLRFANGLIYAYVYGGYVYLDSPELQELLGVMHGLELAKKCLVRNVELIVDSLDVFRYLEDNINPPFPTLDPVPPPIKVEVDDAGFISVSSQRRSARFQASDISPVVKSNDRKMRIYDLKIRVLEVIRRLVDFFSTDGRQFVMDQRLREQNFLADCTTRICEIPEVGPVYVFSTRLMPNIVIPECLRTIARRDFHGVEPYIRIDYSRYQP